MIKAGTIIRSKVNNTTPPKIKFRVILAADKDKVSYAYVFINSEVNVNVLSIQAQACQHLIVPAKNPFLSHDSYVDCSKIFQHTTCADLEAIITANPAAVVGNLHPDDLAIVLKIVRESKTTHPNILSVYKFK